MAENVLYYGDNLGMLRRYVRDESVDLIYLDPPFNSNANYNVLFAAKDGTQSTAQIQAFEDTWEWNEDAARQYVDTVEHGGAVSGALEAFRHLLGSNDMLAYLTMMAPRLVELHRVLKPTGSIYLHCDPTASHYLKLLLDAIFGGSNFRNEIIWHYKFRMMDSDRIFNRKHDVIFFYGKSKLAKLDMSAVAEPWTRDDIIRTRKQAIYTNEEGREWIWMPGGRGHSKSKPKFLDQIMSEGKALDDVWDIPVISSSAKERLGYPTQKPETLLERIIKASSKPGDVVLDPFCGCGTTIAVAQRLDRKWIGIDVTHLAIGLIRYRLAGHYGDSVEYEVVGEPTTVEEAQELARTQPFQFQAWALGLVDARRDDSARKGADRGIDGRLIFHDEADGGKSKHIIFSVKAGKVQVSHVRDLVGVLDREKAALGALISFEEPTKPMRIEAADAGFYTSPWDQKKYPRIQLLTVGELLAGKTLDRPRTTGGNVTYKQAPRVIRKVVDQRDAFEQDPD